ncbi:Formamidopyrimidine-DNA glycosylase, partial [Leucoagaricus sp. SymC.cos]
EVERATRLLNTFGAGKKIMKVETTEDTLVFSGMTHTEFAETLTGRKMIQTHRYGRQCRELTNFVPIGKVFYMELDGAGKHPVMHFGMTGMLHVWGNLPVHYREAPSDASDPEWPPRWMKFILHFVDSKSGQTTEIAFRDARRLGRIRLCTFPSSEPPISDLGFDPIHSMPPLAEFSNLINKRKGAAIKALLLDQSFSAGIGNWVADEVLYHARIHPEQRCSTLTEEQRQVLYERIMYVCRTATSVNADDGKFPEHWLFKHRWGKGSNKKSPTTLLLHATNAVIRAKPSGEPATIKWVTVGGRTSAYVVELQILSEPSLTVKSSEVCRSVQAKFLYIVKFTGSTV